jgi:mannose-6-phosphate isomerase-like protein (cupin superfamily)
MAAAGEALVATGATFAIREWAHGPNDGPPLHVHHLDDEAWHVLEGTLSFRFADRSFDAAAGATVFAPAGVAHTYGNPGPGSARYLIVSTQRIFDLIEALHALENPTSDELAATYRRFESEVLEST